MALSQPTQTVHRKKNIPWGEIFALIGFLLVFGVVLFPVFAQHKGSGPIPALSNIKQVDLGIMMFASDYNNSTPDMQDAVTFQKMLAPYVKSPAVFMDPTNNRQFQLNDKLSHVDLTKLKHPDKTILVYGLVNDFGARYVGYADGHARSLQQKDFLDQLSHTQKLPPILGPMAGNWRFTSGELDIQKNGTAEMVRYTGPSGKAEWSSDDRFTAFDSKDQIRGRVVWNSNDEFALEYRGKETVFDRIVEPAK